MKAAGHLFPSTMHALASGIKKLQTIAEDGQGTRLYRGLGTLFFFCAALYASLRNIFAIIIFNHLSTLGGLDVRPFMSSQGFTETAFMSTTRDLAVALEYSGIKAGKVGSVLPPPPPPLCPLSKPSLSYFLSLSLSLSLSHTHTHTYEFQRVPCSSAGSL